MREIQFRSSFKKQFRWNLMSKYTVKLMLIYNFMKYSERKVSQCILPLSVTLNLFILATHAIFKT